MENENPIDSFPLEEVERLRRVAYLQKMLKDSLGHFLGTPISAEQQEQQLLATMPKVLNGYLEGLKAQKGLNDWNVGVPSKVTRWLLDKQNRGTYVTRKLVTNEETGIIKPLGEEEFHVFTCRHSGPHRSRRRHRQRLKRHVGQIYQSLLMTPVEPLNYISLTIHVEPFDATKTDEPGVTDAKHLA